MKKFILPLILLVLFVSCNTQKIPQGAEVVKDFDKNKYLGDWYEIARFDFYFERDLDNTMARYELNDDGTIKVINSGYDTIKKEWTKSEGKAKFRGSDDIGALEVSFFGPFYSAYNVLAIEGDYEHALVAGKDKDLLWILSRNKKLPDNIRQQFLEQAERIGFDTSKLVWPAHDRNRPATIE